MLTLIVSVRRVSFFSFWHWGFGLLGFENDTLWRGDGAERAQECLILIFFFVKKKKRKEKKTKMEKRKKNCVVFVPTRSLGYVLHVLFKIVSETLNSILMFKVNSGLFIFLIE